MAVQCSKSSKGKGKGNTKTLPAPAKKWTFTANNYSEEEIVDFCSKCSNIGGYFFGREIGESGTPHLQGFIELITKGRPLGCFKGLKAASWHWEKMKGTIKDNIVYCSKDGRYETNTPGWMPKKTLGCKPHAPVVLRDWQELCLTKIFELAKDDRQILWVWDNGGTGKSVFARYLVENYNTLIVNGASKYCLSTLFKMEEKPEIVVYALPRDKEDYVSYGALEQIRDGLFFTGFGTEGTGMCNFGYHPVVLVLCNFAPNFSKLSEDRWCVFGPGDFGV